MSVDRHAAAGAIDAFLRAIGRDPATDPALRATGARVADAYIDELCAGYGVDTRALLAAHTVPGHTDLVAIRDVAVTTMCPHHLLPASGTAAVAFAPGETLVGLGVLVELVDAFAHRLILQEDIGTAVVRELFEVLKPSWVGCRLLLSHGCVTARGERRHGARVETVAFAGDLKGKRRQTAERALGVGR